MYTVTSPMRYHPWFDPPSMKRKRPASPPLDNAPPQKRRRSPTALERGFANLTLDTPMAPAPPLALEQPIVEEPESPRFQIPDVLMKPSSWYEPEPDRIVITDLGSFSEEDADDEASLAPISPALIAHLSRPLAPPIPPPPPSQALVLFRPLTLPRPAQTPIEKPKDDDDAMDVEP
ncbi:40S ribosomal protein [Favolaschia claudopus]|uniref:40S ribosomal protein n=1 Tax=Favolaschia claudopus TaxID=2862362 RepID=A0AAW0DWG7_9AGAR